MSVLPVAALGGHPQKSDIFQVGNQLANFAWHASTMILEKVVSTVAALPAVKAGLLFDEAGDRGLRRDLLIRSALDGIDFASREVGFQYVLLDHALGVKERAVQGDGVAHHGDEAVVLAVEARGDDLAEFGVK